MFCEVTCSFMAITLVQYVTGLYTFYQDPGCFLSQGMTFLEAYFCNNDTLEWWIHKFMAADFFH